VAMAGVVEYIEQSCPCIQTRHDAMNAYGTNSTSAAHAAKWSN